jgi:MSHA biogenesis protein MshN
MSLINKMLRDLDARRAPAADRAQLQDMVHATQQRPGRALPWVALAIAVMAAGGAGTWYWLAGRSQPPAAAAVQVAAAPVPAPQPASAVPRAADVPSVVERRADAGASAAPAPVAVARTETPRPKKEEVKARAGQAGAAATPRPAAPAPSVASKPPAAAPAAVPATAVAGAKPAPPPSTEPSIEKRPHTALASEAAENEYNKAIVALRRGATAEAVTGLQSALRLDMLHVPARQALLSLLLRQQQWGEAQALAEEGLSLDPGQVGWAIALARLQMENGRLMEATETLARHARYADRNADYLAFQALLLQKQKRYHEACDRYIAAVTLRPGEARWWYGLGVSLEADARPQEAHEAFVKAKDAGNLPPELAGSLKFHLR